MQTANYCVKGYKTMGLLLSPAPLQGENNNYSPQSASYTDR